MRLAVSVDHASVTYSAEAGSEKRRVACHAVVLETFPPHCRSAIWPSFPWVGEVAHGSGWEQGGEHATY
jgi:hypothetical protein